MPECTKAILTANGCLSGKVLSNHDQLVRRVYLDMLQLAAIGGTDYSDDIPALNIAGNALSCGFQSDDFDTAELVIAAANATAAGASVPATKDALASAVACLENYSDYQLEQMKLLLYCALGEGAAQ